VYQPPFNPTVCSFSVFGSAGLPGTRHSRAGFFGFSLMFFPRVVCFAASAHNDAREALVSQGAQLQVPPFACSIKTPKPPRESERPFLLCETLFYSPSPMKVVLSRQEVTWSAVYLLRIHFLPLRKNPNQMSRNASGAWDCLWHFYQMLVCWFIIIGQIRAMVLDVLSVGTQTSLLFLFLSFFCKRNPTLLTFSPLWPNPGR
jgi:hypothetical protein